MYEKRRFIEAAVLAQIVAIEHIPSTKRSSRDLVNRASELWDEIEHQTKDDKDKN